jgi:hypothetical protein
MANLAHNDSPRKGRRLPVKKVEKKKEDGRYIIFYSFPKQNKE